VLETAGSALAAFLNGANLLRLQVITASVMGITAITLKFVLVVKIGLPGVVLATILAYLFLVLVPWLFLMPGVIRNLNLK